MSGELGREIFRMRMLHIPWELQKPEHIAKGGSLSSGEVTFLNGHFYPQHFSISNQYFPRGMDLDKKSSSIFRVLYKKEAK